MAAKTKIEWTDATYNPVSGCSKVSDGCTNCYGEAMARRFNKDWKPWTAANAAHNVTIHPERLKQPLHWRKPRKIFVCSMGDLFHEGVHAGFIDRVFAVMGAARQHTFQVLTKRPERMRSYIGAARERSRQIAKWIGVKVQTDPFWISANLWEWPLPNVWLGVTAENQRTTDERIPLLLQTPATKRFVSVEPLLEPIDLTNITILKPDGYAPGVYLDALRGHVKGPDDMLPEKLDWVICGGESGPKARPMSPDWARSIRDQCQAADVPFLFKQWGEWAPKPYLWPKHKYRLAFDKKEDVVRVGKKAAGRELDGRTWEETPE